MVLSASLSASLPFIHLDWYLNDLLGIRQTDYIRGYFGVWIPSLVLAMCLLILSRLLSGRSFTAWIMESVAGILILLSPTAVSTYGYVRNGWSLEWRYRLIWGEAALAVICFCLFLRGRRGVTLTAGLSGFFGHCLFWYWSMGNGFRSFNQLYWGPLYDGAFGIMLGTSALLVWGLYSYRTREHSLLTASSGTSDHPAVSN